MAERHGKRRSNQPSFPIYAPQAWPTWLLVGFAWLIAHLPVRAIFALGSGIGRAMNKLNTRRKRITQQNLRACFPDKSDAEIDALTREVLINVSIGGLELMMPWLNPKRSLHHRFEISGLSHLNAAVAEGRGVILIGAHFAVMDVISAPLAQCGPIDVMYRYNKNPVWEWLQVSGRARYFDGVIERKDTRQVLKRLRKGRVIWYAPDQDYGAKHSVFAPFFGIQAATITATSRFANLNQSPVLMLIQRRDRARGTWSIEFSPIMENFPSGDDVSDATLMNQMIEDEVRKDPSQYLWLHKRFKTRPPGEDKFYQL